MRKGYPQHECYPVGHCHPVGERYQGKPKSSSVGDFWLAQLPSESDTSLFMCWEISRIGAAAMRHETSGGLTPAEGAVLVRALVYFGADEPVTRAKGLTAWHYRCFSAVDPRRVGNLIPPGKGQVRLSRRLRCRRYACPVLLSLYACFCDIVEQDK
ncbi:hypothetical protein PoB_004075300 [Plakobranchus ocellatus]|uniref:Uncharacterized protein n=1 Tax=Plakobranchus ocellatus TaxID=259542 RepID=A0AAV4B642_9GAST|nr:hypothetical protein PoB_004075300 [Plakobranchus ocellatus]